MTALPSLLVAAALATFAACAAAAVPPPDAVAKGPGPDWCAGPRATSNHAPMRAEAATPPQSGPTTPTAGTPDAEATASGCPSLTLG